jgi:RNA polymerase sigma-70 factor (ECF subfamily)
MEDPTSPNMVAMAQRGDIEALGKLYDLHYPAILRYFQSKVADRCYAEDLTGELFRRMLAGLPRYREVGLPFRAWLFRIAHNTLIDFYRQENHRMALTPEDTNTPSQDQVDPADVVEQKVTMDHARHALAELDQGQREVVALRFLCGLSLKETALTLGKTEDAIKAIQRRGLAALRLNLVPFNTQSGIF